MRTCTARVVSLQSVRVRQRRRQECEVPARTRMPGSLLRRDVLCSALWNNLHMSAHVSTRSHRTWRDKEAQLTLSEQHARTVRRLVWACMRLLRMALHVWNVSVQRKRANRMGDLRCCLAMRRRNFSAWKQVLYVYVCTLKRLTTKELLIARGTS